MADKELGVKVTGDISDINQALDKLSDMLNSFVDKSIDLGVNVDSSGLDNLNTELNAATANMGEIDDAAKLAGENINSSMEIANEGINNMAKGTEQATEDMTNLGTEGMGAGEGIATGMESALLAMAAVSAGTELLAENIADINSSIEKMSTMQELTGVGLDEGQYRDMIANISNASFPTEDAILYVKTLKQMGVNSSLLDENANALNDIALSAGLSSDQVLRLSSNLQVVGVDMNNISSSFDALAYAQANTKGGLETFSKYMDRYGIKFKEMGLNADQAAVLIGAASKEFGTSRAGMMAFNQVLQDSGGNLGVLEQKLHLGAGALSNASAETARYNNVIETNSQKVEENATVWQQLMAVFEDIKVRGGDLLGTITSIGAAITGAIVAPGAFLKVLDKLIPGKEYFTKYTSALMDLGGKAKDVIKTGWGKLFGDAGSDIGSKLLDKIKNVVPKSIDDLLSKLFKGGKFGSGMLFTKEDFVGDPGSQKRTTWEEVFKGWGLSQSELNKWNEEMNKGPIETFKSNTGALASFLQTIGGNIISASGSIVAPVFETLQWLAGQAGQWGQAAIDMINNLINGLIGGIPDLDTVLGNITSTIEDGLDWLMTLPEKAWQWGWDIITSWTEGFGSALDGAKGWIEDKLSYLSGLLEGHSPPKEGPLSDIDVWGKNIGKTFIEGIGQGLSDNTSLISNSLTNLGNNFNLNSFSLPAPAVSNLSRGTGNINVTNHFDLTGANIGSKADAQGVGQVIGTAVSNSLAETLRAQATNAGVSVINMIR